MQYFLQAQISDMVVLLILCSPILWVTLFVLKNSAQSEFDADLDQPFRALSLVRWIHRLYVVLFCILAASFVLLIVYGYASELQPVEQRRINDRIEFCIIFGFISLMLMVSCRKHLSVKIQDKPPILMTLGQSSHQYALHLDINHNLSNQSDLIEVMKAIADCCEKLQKRSAGQIVLTSHLFNTIEKHEKLRAKLKEVEQHYGGRIIVEAEQERIGIWVAYRLNSKRKDCNFGHLKLITACLVPHSFRKWLPAWIKLSDRDDKRVIRFQRKAFWEPNETHCAPEY